MTRQPIPWTRRAHLIAGWAVFAGFVVGLPVLAWVAS